MCCHTEIEVEDLTFCLTQSQYIDTGPASPSVDPIYARHIAGLPPEFQFLSHWYDSMRKNPHGASGNRTPDHWYDSTRKNPGAKLVSATVEAEALTTRPARRLCEQGCRPDRSSTDRACPECKKQAVGVPLQKAGRTDTSHTNTGTVSLPTTRERQDGARARFLAPWAETETWSDNSPGNSQVYFVRRTATQLRYSSCIRLSSILSARLCDCYRLEDFMTCGSITSLSKR